MATRVYTPQEKDRIALIMNQVEPKGARIVAHAVPTRAFRVLMLKDEKVCRVEQIDPKSWKWQTLSTHSGDTPWESFGVALNDCIEKQEAFRQKIVQEQVKQRQAGRIAEAARLTAGVR